MVSPSSSIGVPPYMTKRGIDPTRGPIRLRGLRKISSGDALPKGSPVRVDPLGDHVLSRVQRLSLIRQSPDVTPETTNSRGISSDHYIRAVSYIILAEPRLPSLKRFAVLVVGLFLRTMDSRFSCEVAVQQNKTQQFLDDPRFVTTPAESAVCAPRAHSHVRNRRRTRL